MGTSVEPRHPRTRARVVQRVTNCAFALCALTTVRYSAVAQTVPVNSAHALARCQGEAHGPGTIIGSMAALTRTNGTILIQIVPAGTDSDAYLGSIASAFGGQAPAVSVPVTTVAQLQRQQSEAQAMPRVISQTKFLFVDRSTAFRCDGLAVGRYHVIAIVPDDAAPADAQRAQSLPSAVIDYYATDVTIPTSTPQRPEIMQASGFRRIARAIGH